jgi:hypothetical protein
MMHSPDFDDCHGPAPTPERPCGDIAPVLAPGDGPRWSLVRHRYILSESPQNAHEKGGPCADRRSRRNKVGWLGGRLDSNQGMAESKSD